ncbi:3496_t:CDS:2 [Dentiscutata heterogama]|uniref:3496_t:CDS:1 n=1 Tax=Dentiscutata heterogama TaxID=1316150 RepID=A0ACA9PC47_9GLOM|nr:3496_t:CDS:2 [Dentiscutata heterogama]
MKKLLIIFILTFLIFTVAEELNLKRKDNSLFSLSRKRDFTCSPSETKCGNDNCCSSSQKCIEGFLCCDNKFVCGDDCCSSSQTCVGGAICCDKNLVCGDDCCSSLQTCVQGILQICCDKNFVCGDDCCSPSQQCKNDNSLLSLFKRQENDPPPTCDLPEPSC